MNRVALASLALAIAAGTANAGLVITEVMAQTTAGTTSTINGDWWELTNRGPAAINLDGYQWADTEDQLGGPTPQPNFFPAFLLQPGQSVIILEEVAANETLWRTNWNAPSSLVIFGTDEMLPSPGVTDTFSGLGSSNDGLFLYDPAGTLLSSYLYTTTTRGTTFEQALDGTNLGLSVVGENGAVRAANGDVGSPGFAVPTPGAVALLGLAGLAGVRRRR
jgi:MYXO-CTERM domain-containing protein